MPESSDASLQQPPSSDSALSAPEPARLSARKPADSETATAERQTNSIALSNQENDCESAASWAARKARTVFDGRLDRKTFVGNAQ